MVRVIVLASIDEVWSFGQVVAFVIFSGDIEFRISSSQRFKIVFKTLTSSQKTCNGVSCELRDNGICCCAGEVMSSWTMGFWVL